jgi:hypothetical protein
LERGVENNKISKAGWAEEKKMKDGHKEIQKKIKRIISSRPLTPMYSICGHRFLQKSRQSSDV